MEGRGGTVLVAHETNTRAGTRENNKEEFGILVGSERADKKYIVALEAQSTHPIPSYCSSSSKHSWEDNRAHPMAADTRGSF